MQKNSIQSRRDEFYQSIRREAKNKIITQRRRQLISANLTINSLVQHFSLPPNNQGKQWNILDILNVIKKELLQPCIVLGDQNHKLAHTQFFNLMAEGLYHQYIKPNQDIFDFFFRFMKLNCHKQLAKYPSYDKTILNVLELLAISRQISDAFKVQILLWVQTTDALTVILNCTPSNQFLPVNKFKNVYKIINLALQSNNKNTVKQAIQVLIKIMFNSDWDDTYQIYSEFNSIMSNLVMQAQHTLSNKEDIGLIAQGIEYIIDVYDSCLINYARSGVALIAALMIVSDIENNINHGLQILKILCSVPDHNMIKLLLEDKQIIATKMWQKFGKTPILAKHRNADIRKLFHGITCNILSNGHYQQVVNFCQKISLKSEEDIIDLIEETLREGQAVEIQYFLLEDLRNLLYYGQRHKDGGENPIKARLQSKKIDKLIQQLASDSNSQICTLANILLENLQNPGEEVSFVQI